MDPLGSNPFAVLTFIAAPAILTNASSVMAQGTATRVARAIDRARSLAGMLEVPGQLPDDEAQLRFRQLGFVNRRMLLMVRAMTAFYLSLGAFAAASFTSLLGAVLVIVGHDLGQLVTMVLALICGGVGVTGLVGGSVLLVAETRLALAILAEETAFVRKRLDRPEQWAAKSGPETAPGETRS